MLRATVMPDSPLHPLLRLLNASFPLGTAFGTRVRVYGAPLVLLLLVGPTLDLLRLLSWGDRLLYVALSLVALYGTVWLHEMGHVAAGWRWHLQTPLITLSPLGGLAHMGYAPPHPRAEMVIAAAGPATHLVLLGLTYPLTRMVGGSPITWSGSALAPLSLEPVPFLIDLLFRLQVALLLFNLLPFYPLDGGRMLRAALATRLHPNRATRLAAQLGLAGAVVLGLYGLLGAGGLGGGLLVAIAISNALACAQALQEARFSEGPYGEPRAPWEQDPEAWRHGAARAREPDREPAAWAPPEPSPRRPRAASREEGISDEALDRLLDRVREVGLSGLSPGERADLERASASRRGRR